MAGETGYAWDVFISYRRDGLMGTWVRDLFFRELDLLLREKRHAIRLFRDERDIEPGAVWPEDLRQAVARSKLILPVLSSAYFASDWCQAEFAAFQARQAAHPKHRLFLPVRFQNCEDRPEKLQWLDFHPHWKLRLGRESTDGYERFLGDVEKVADRILDRVDHAPAWQADWPSLEVPSLTPDTFPFPGVAHVR